MAPAPILRVPSSTCPGLQLSLNQLQTLLGLGSGPCPAQRAQQSSCGLGLHIRFELWNLASHEHHPWLCTVTSVWQAASPCLLRMSRLRACVLFCFLLCHVCCLCVLTAFCALGAVCPLFPCVYVISLPVSYLCIPALFMTVEIQSTHHAEDTICVTQFSGFLLNAQSHVTVCMCAQCCLTLPPHGL